MERRVKGDEGKAGKINIYTYKLFKMNFKDMLKDLLSEAKKEKPSAGLSKEKKSDIVKQAKKGKDFGKKGKGFKDVVAKAKKSGAEDPEAVAGAAFWKNIKRENAEGVDPEGQMSKIQLAKIIEYAQKIHDSLEDDSQLDAWVQDHIAQAAELMDQVGHFMEHEEESGDIYPVDEKHLTKAELSKKKDILASMAKKQGKKGEKEMSPKDYAIATAQAKKSAE